MPPQRPFFQKKTEELRSLFETCRSDHKQNLEILLELGFRKTSIARVLREEIERELKSSQAATTLAPAVLHRPQAILTPATVPHPLPAIQIAQPKAIPDLPRATPPGEKSTAIAQPIAVQNEPPPQLLPIVEKPISKAATAPNSGLHKVQPLGVPGRPSAWAPKLKDEVQLGIKPSNTLAKVFCAALFELIRELKQKNDGTQQFALEDGRRLSADLRGYSYQFEFTEEANLFESAKVDVVIGGKSIAGQITGLFQGQIIVTLEADFGPVILNCILRIDNTALLQALHDRLAQIEAGTSPSFRMDFATSVIQNKGLVRLPAPSPAWPWYPEPNQQQQEFVRMALANELTWLWGPPGTGKTDVLAIFTRLQYESGKRVLICSNTNQAVDQLLLKLCQKMSLAKEPALQEGRVLRLGRIEHDELRQTFEELITVDGIVARRSKELTQRKLVVEAELVLISKEDTRAKEVLELFDTLNGKSERRANAEKELRRLGDAKRSLADELQSANSDEHRFLRELHEFESAGGFRRFFMRDEKTIRRDLRKSQELFEDRREKMEARAIEQATQQKTVEQLRRAEDELKSRLISEDRNRCERTRKDCESRSVPLRAELSRISEQLEKIQNSALTEARIIGATATRTFLRPTEFSSFDTIILDEASMVLLPAVFLVAGLAKERVVIAGDFRQLPPIVPTEQQAIFDELGQDVFTRAGIAEAVAKGTALPRFVMLRQQYRMDDRICRVISATFYKGNLVTAPSRYSSQPSRLPSPFQNRLTLIDTSSVSPFTTRNAFKSHLNLMHALVIRNLLFHLQQYGCFQDANGANAIGLCSPYAAQIKLLHAIADGHGWSKLLRISTAHRFQGDERETIVIDLVDSVGEFNAGLFLQANHLGASGAKLFNVAFSRAKENVIVVGNLDFLDQKLPKDAILRGLLHDFQNNGETVDVRDVLAMYPIADDLERFGTRPQLDPETTRTGVFGETDFWKTCRLDLAAARKSLVIFSGFITPARTADIGDVLRSRINAGVKVRCVTRPPAFNGGIPEDQGRAALVALESIGATIDLRQDIHEKVVVIDGRIVWFGSLNPLSHSSKTSEIMGRVDNEAFAIQIAQLLSLRPTSVLNENGESFAEPENPRCPNCQSWTVARRGQYGRFLQCEAKCGWTESLNQPRYGRRKKT